FFLGGRDVGGPRLSKPAQRVTKVEPTIALRWEGEAVKLITKVGSERMICVGLNEQVRRLLLESHSHSSVLVAPIVLHPAISSCGRKQYRLVSAQFLLQGSHRRISRKCAHVSAVLHLRQTVGARGVAVGSWFSEVSVHCAVYSGVHAGEIWICRGR